MDNYAKLTGRGGCFILNAGDNTSSLNDNITGDSGNGQDRYWAFMALEANSTLSILKDGGETAFSSGTVGSNLGFNVAASYAWPVNVLITSSTPNGFSQLSCNTGSFLVWRQKNSLENLD